MLNFVKIRQVGAKLIHADRQTDGQTDMTKLIVAVRNFCGCAHEWDTLTKTKVNVLDFKLSPCSKCCVLSSGSFLGVSSILHTYPPMKMEQSVPKRRHIKLRRRGTTQKKAYNKRRIANGLQFGVILLEVLRKPRKSQGIQVNMRFIMRQEGEADHLPAPSCQG